jgi:lipid-A-disaccharide synthase
VSAGEASGDLYAATLVDTLRRRRPEVEFFGCAGPRMQRAGVRPVVDAASLSVVGLAEVLGHIPRIYGEFRKMCRAAAEARPAAAVLTDSPDFHLRLAAKLHRLGIPVIYLVAPQAWAWRRGRVRILRRNVKRLLCIFPFEEEFFSNQGVAAEYIGHPLARLVRPSQPASAFRARHSLESGRPLVTLLPGSRPGEVSRHLPELKAAAGRILARDMQVAVAAPGGFFEAAGRDFFERRGLPRAVRVIEGETWDAIAHADIALAASGTVTIETALLGTPMVTFYRVTPLTWLVGRPLVRVPFYSMVNLVARRRVVPELIQNEMTGERLAAEVFRLWDDQGARERMRRDLAEVAGRLRDGREPMERAADIVEDLLLESGAAAGPGEGAACS